MTVRSILLQKKIKKQILSYLLYISNMFKPAENTFPWCAEVIRIPFTVLSVSQRFMASTNSARNSALILLTGGEDIVSVASPVENEKWRLKSLDRERSGRYWRPYLLSSGPRVLMIYENNDSVLRERIEKNRFF